MWTIRVSAIAIVALQVAGCLPAGFKLTALDLSTTTPQPSTKICTAVTGIKYGVNAHSITDVALYGDYESQFKILYARNIRSIRVDVNLANDTDPYVATRFRKLLVAAKEHCIEVNPMIMVPFAWGDRTDFGKYPAGDDNALYQQGYNRVHDFAEEFVNDIKDWELGNELNLINAQNGLAPNFGDGKTAAEWNIAPYTDWRFVLKGMSDAIADLNAEYGKNMRRVLNTTTTHFGFLSYMQSHGVNFEVISYHYYELANTNPHLYWGTFDLFTTLATFGKPLKVNEINCAEIYNGSFVNSVGGNLFDQCATTLKTQLTYFRDQTSANIEEITLYELFDNAAKPGAEGRFGLMFDLSRPKNLLLLLTAFAGGKLSAQELTELQSRGLIP